MYLYTKSFVSYLLFSLVPDSDQKLSHLLFEKFTTPSISKTGGDTSACGKLKVVSNDMVHKHIDDLLHIWPNWQRENFSGEQK